MRRIACVVGAGSVIGGAISTRLAREGYYVVGMGRANPGTSDLSQFVHCDVTSDCDVERATGEILHMGVPEVVVYSAGAAAMGHTLEVPQGVARNVFEVNFWGVVRTLSALLPPMRAAGRGTVVVVLSLAAIRAIPFEAC
jgi:NAD(P)-dependent dehydrogenase (short-subunit alcohol dehydrogenase family)